MKITEVIAQPISNQIFIESMESGRQLPNHALIMSMVLPIPPITKKNSQQIVRGRKKSGGTFTRIIASEQYLTYEKDSKRHIHAAWKGKGLAPINYGINIIARFWLKRMNIGDHVGYLQALGDVLEKHCLLDNDCFIQWVLPHDEHWFKGKDDQNPRTEIEIYRFRHPEEVRLARNSSVETDIKEIDA